MKLIIGHLYPKLLNIYGDRGNIICLKNRCSWRKIKVRIKPISIGQTLNGEVDLFFGGGGQDRQQLIVAKDLQKKAVQLRKAADRGVPMLTICGTYQLFGHYFKTHTGKKIPGISIFNALTIAGHKRKIGNIVIEPSITMRQAFKPLISGQLKKDSLAGSAFQLVGFENHSGNTFINKPASRNPRQWAKASQSGKSKPADCQPLGRVIKGSGNNGQDGTEGAVYQNTLGCYLHGPVLPKNPHLADWLIKKALEIKYEKPINLKPLDDRWEWQAHQQAQKRS